MSVALQPYGDSYWLDEASELVGPSTEPLTKNLRCELAVVGGGYTGLWTAILAKSRNPGLDVVVLEGSRVGRGPSGMNGGFMSGYRGYRKAFERAVGPTLAESIVEAGERAQVEITDFIRRHGAEDEVWLNTEPGAKIAVSRHQLSTLREKAGASVLEGPSIRVQDGINLERVVGVSAISGGATVQPARLVLFLKRVAEEMGIPVYENSRVREFVETSPVSLRVNDRTVEADSVVLATGSEGIRAREGRKHLTILSAYAFVTEPMPDLLAQAGWKPGRGGTDARTFIHWFRSTPDGRMVFGTTAGPIARGGRWDSILADRGVVRAAFDEFKKLFPEFENVAMDRAWAGPIDMSADQFPFFGKRRSSRVYFGHGFSGHGVNAGWIGGRCLSSLALGADDEWSNSVFCTRRVPALPPEPLRQIAGSMIKRAVLRIEDANAVDEQPSRVDRAISSIPRLLGMKIGIRD